MLTKVPKDTHTHIILLLILTQPSFDLPNYCFALSAIHVPLVCLSLPSCHHGEVGELTVCGREVYDVTVFFVFLEEGARD